MSLSILQTFLFLNQDEFYEIFIISTGLQLVFLLYTDKLFIFSSHPLYIKYAISNRQVSSKKYPLLLTLYFYVSMIYILIRRGYQNYFS